MGRKQGSNRQRRVNRGIIRPPEQTDLSGIQTQGFEPPGVMWPESGSGFEPSSYSPAGGMQQESARIANYQSDPGVGWRALRNSPAIWIFLAAALILVGGALIGAALS